MCLGTFWGVVFRNTDFWLKLVQFVLNAAKRECSSVESLADFWRSPCILPAAEKTRSTPAEDAGAAKYCLIIIVGDDDGSRAATLSVGSFSPTYYFGSLLHAPFRFIYHGNLPQYV